MSKPWLYQAAIAYLLAVSGLVVSGMVCDVLGGSLALYPVIVLVCLMPFVIYCHKIGVLRLDYWLVQSVVLSLVLVGVLFIAVAAFAPQLMQRGWFRNGTLVCGIILGQLATTLARRVWEWKRGRRDATQRRTRN